MNSRSKAPVVCSGCEGRVTDAAIFLPQYPVIQNYRYDSPADAKAVPRRDLELKQCATCGLVFNALFDPAAVPYDERYENRQNHSAAFMELMTRNADHLATHYALRDRPVLEVGCGKGEFLKLLCSRHQLRGIGYDTSCEEDGPDATGQIHFYQRYVTRADVRAPVSALVCRHVIEHVPDLQIFMRLLFELSAAGDARLTYLETPAWEWIVEQNAFWDVFYEHCNYFSMPTLRFLAEQAGFQVLNHRRIFGGQYQALELVRDVTGQLAAPEVTAPISLARFGENFEAAPRVLRDRLVASGAEKGWAIWGAGAKGVALANALTTLPPQFLIDSNPAKQGTFVPGAGIPVLAPADQRVSEIAVVLIANPVYQSEIEATLLASGYRPKIITL